MYRDMGYYLEQRLGIEPVGPLHLERISFVPACIERGELMHAVPLSPGEEVNISHKEWPNTSEDQAVRDELVKNLARYQDTHPFQEYVRCGCKNMSEFVDGWTWTFKYESSSHTLFYNATRHEYVVSQPIGEPTTNRLILNYYSSEKAKKTQKPIDLLKPTDSRFFATV